MKNRINKELLSHFTKLYENPPVDLINQFNETKKIDLDYELFPCFFTGDISRKNSIVTISLNPKIDKAGIKKKKEEQGDNFHQWIYNCIDGFNGYKEAQKLNPIWTNLYKVLTNKIGSLKNVRADFLQQNVVNLDWCYYYSTNFPTIGKNELINSDYTKLYNLFTTNISFLIKKIEPKLIFIHGKTLEQLVINNLANNLKFIQKMNNGQGDYNLFSGYYKDSSIPIIFLDRFINRSNSNYNIGILHEFICNKLPKK